ncbi:MAG: glycosyl transferase [Clostridiales bacterium]|nr:glycosyl transferase [Clostridiales bacterium]
MQTDISVVIPVFNSEKSLEKLYKRLTAVLENLCGNFEIIFVDDGSHDDSYDEIIRLYENDRRIKAIRLKKNFGQQNAIMCGLRYAKSEYVITMDDDLQNPPEEIEKLLLKLKEGFDAVYGIPIQKMHSAGRNLGAAARDKIFCIFLRMPRNIKLSSYRIMHQRLVSRIIQDNTSFVYISAIILKNTKNIGNAFVKHHPRPYGSSNYSFARLLKLMFKIIKNYSRLGLFSNAASKPQYEIRDIQIST